MDVTRGVGILIIVFGHSWFVASSPTVLYPLLSPFILPLFFFISGVFFRTEQPFGEMALRKADALLKPFFVTMLGYVILRDLLRGQPLLPDIGGVLYASVDTLPWQALWYLPHFWVATLFAWFMLRVIQRLGLSLAASCVLLAVQLGLGILFLKTFWQIPVEFGGEQYLLPGLPFSLDITLISSAHFMFGYVLRDVLRRHQSSLLTLCIALAVTTASFLYYPTVVDMAQRRYDHWFWATVQAVSGVYLCWALRQVYSAQLFRKAAEELGLHPYDLPAANASGPWTNPYGVQMGPCNFCGFCSGYACYMYSKASPNLNILPALRQTPLFELRANCNVLKVNLDSDGRQATGVTYVDAQGREIVQPAKLVIISAFQFHNVRLLLLSGIGKPYDPRTGEGVVGKNFAYQNMATIKAFFDKDVHTNPFVGTGGGGVAVDDFNADNFDHGPLGFVGGSPMWVNQAGSKPIGGLAVPPGTPSWGSGWKQAVKDAYTHTVSMDAHGSNMTYRDNYLDLDPTYKDAYGQPLLRMTFDWKDNEIRMSRYVTEHMRKIAEAMNPKAISVSVKNFGDHFNTRVYQTTHLLGGAIMGSDPKTSVLNRYLQSWDVHNVFVMGASAFPQGTGYNPTGLVAALAYWSAKAIREQYLKNPGPLVQA